MIKIFTGNPVRPEVTMGSRDEGRKLARFTDDKPVLLVLGGSQGAMAINEAILRHLDQLLPLCNVIHLTGRGKESAVQRPGYWSLPFAQEELPHLYAAADAAVSRAGAGSISELAAAGIPCILIPLRAVGHDHQMKNARAVERAGGCVLLHQEHLSTTLVPAIRRLMDHADERQEIAKRLAPLHHRDASKEIAEILLRTAGKKT